MNTTKLQLPIVMGCVLHEDRALLIRRNEPELPELHDKWEFPGGKIEFGENPAQACQREVLEETGIRIQPGQLIPIPYTKVRNYEKKKVHALVICYECRFIETLFPAPTSDKISEIAWRSLENFDLVKIQPGTLHFLNYILERDKLSNRVNFSQYFSFISLESIKENENRYRKYCISIQTSVETRSKFIVRCSWGRISSEMQGSVTEFSDADDMLDFVGERLRKRHKNGYTIVEKSQGFPYVAGIEMIPKLDREEKQLNLLVDAL